MTKDVTEPAVCCRILRNKIGSLHHLGAPSHYDKHPTSLYNTLYPAAAAYTAAAAAYSSMTPQQVPQPPPVTPQVNQSGGGVGKAAATPSPPGCRPTWPGAQAMSDLLGHVNMSFPRHQDSPHHNYNYYNYLQLQLPTCAPQANSLPHAPIPSNHHFSSPLANGFSSHLSAPLQNSFSNPLSSMMSPPGLTPQPASL